MKTIFKFAIYTALALAAVPFANLDEVQAQTTAPAAAQGACTDDAKAAWYADFTKFRTTDPTKAYGAAKQYLGACPTEEGQIPAYLKKWVIAYDKEARKIKLSNLFIVQRKYNEANVAAKEVLADEPDHLLAHIALGYGGYVIAVTTKNESGNADALNYAKRAIQLIESGKTTDDWAPFKSKDDALAYLNYTAGFLQRTSNPTEALNYFIKAARFESEIKKNAQTYAFIAGAYDKEYQKQSAKYQELYANKDETPESKLAFENINQVVDRLIDALARAIAVAGTDANSQTLKTQWMASLTPLYAFRNKSEAGLNEYISTVMSKPLPPVPTPITVLPAAPATSTTTPASGTPTGNTVGNGVVAPGARPATAPASTGLTTAPKMQPATTTSTTAPKTTTPTTTTSTTATKPKPKNNHAKPRTRRG